jgi:hypothetical protein
MAIRLGALAPVPAGHGFPRSGLLQTYALL